jgi:hypothetical protein
MPSPITFAGARVFPREIHRYENRDIEETPHLIHWEAHLDSRDDDGLVVGAAGATPEAAEDALRAKLLAVRAAIDGALAELG